MVGSVASIRSCYGCVAPKRHPGCHDHCPEYLAEKAELGRLKAAYDRQQDINGYVCHDRGVKVYKALKNRRFKKI